METYQKISLKTGQFYTVSEKRLANLHFFPEKCSNMGFPFLDIKHFIAFVTG